MVFGLLFDFGCDNSYADASKAGFGFRVGGFAGEGFAGDRLRLRRGQTNCRVWKIVFLSHGYGNSQL